MKPTSRLINTSRGPIVVEADLIAALKDKIIAGAAIDVFDQEPLPLDHPFRALPNLLATPHIGYVSRGLYARSQQAIALSTFRQVHASQEIGRCCPRLSCLDDVAVWRMAQTIWEGPDGDRF
jgi:phosphoglycerate dehydrogenase-like enzyme